MRYAVDQIIRSNLLFQAGINSGRARSGQYTMQREINASVCYLPGYGYHVYHRQQDPQIPDRYRDEPRDRARWQYVVPVSDPYVRRCYPFKVADNSCVNNRLCV